MAHSSYDFLFAKPAMRWLLNDYLNPGYRGWLHFRPAEDPRLSVSADLHGGSTEQLGRDTTGAQLALGCNDCELGDVMRQPKCLYRSAAAIGTLAACAPFVSVRFTHYKARGPNMRAAVVLKGHALHRLTDDAIPAGSRRPAQLLRRPRRGQGE